MKTTLFLGLSIAVAVVCVLYFAYAKRGRHAAALGAPERDVGALTKSLYRPAILVQKTNEPTKSYMGGAPPDSPSVVWPSRKGHALSFIACIDCAELPRSSELDWMPRDGLLLFFYDMMEQPWGFDPKDKGGFATLYLPSAAPRTPNTAAPPSGLPANATIPKHFLKFTSNSLPPSWETEELAALGLTDEEMDSFMEQRSALYGDQPHHQMGGYPDPIQNPEMDEECQLVTHGLYCGDATGYQDPRAAELKKGASEWSLLFQMDSDDELNVMWGDAGMIYFWIRREDARA